VHWCCSHHIVSGGLPLLTETDLALLIGSNKIGFYQSHALPKSCSTKVMLYQSPFYQSPDLQEWILPKSGLPENSDSTKFRSPKVRPPPRLASRLGLVKWQTDTQTDGEIRVYLELLASAQVREFCFSLFQSPNIQKWQLMHNWMSDHLQKKWNRGKILTNVSLCSEMHSTNSA
jgi:hypothetical protein